VYDEQTVHKALVEPALTGNRAGVVHSRRVHPRNTWKEFRAAGADNERDASALHADTDQVVVDIGHREGGIKIDDLECLRLRGRGQETFRPHRHLLPLEPSHHEPGV
jgi:hypothetical protein